MKKEFEVISKIIQNNKRVLDIGCGDGTLMEYLKVNQQNDGITWVIFNRPEKRNAMSPTFHAEMVEILDLLETDPDTKLKSAKTAMLFSRTNTLLSLPMLLSMVAAQNLY